MPDEDLRLTQLRHWLDLQLPDLFARQGWGVVPSASLTSASSDASFRRYFRWEGGGRTLIVMDAPPPQEDCAPFVKIAGLLAQADVHVPQILAADLAQGFLLLPDLGRHTYLDVITAENADELFAAALNALLAGTGQVVVDQPGGYVHGQAWGDMVEHIVPVLQRGHAHLGAAQGLGDVLQREAVGAGRCQAQRGREQCQGHMGDQAAVVVLHGALSLPAPLYLITAIRGPLTEPRPTAR